MPSAIGTTFVWEGNDPFGGQTFERPWFPADTMALAKQKADAAFDMFRILGVPYFCFHDHDVRPEGDTLAESHKRLNEMADYFAEKMATGRPEAAVGHGQHVFQPALYVWGLDQPRPGCLCLLRINREGLHGCDASLEW